MKEDIFVNDWNEVCFALPIYWFLTFSFCRKNQQSLALFVEKSRKA
jgi:hypothetical protein